MARLSGRRRAGRSRWVLVALLAAGALLAYSGFELSQRIGFNRALAGGGALPAYRADSPHARFARAYRLHLAGRYDQAVELYATLTAVGDGELVRATHFNLADIYLRQSVAGLGTSAARTDVALVALAKEVYRDLLRADPTAWDARYNLARTLQIQPEPGDLSEDEQGALPVRSPRAPAASGLEGGLP